MRSCAAKLALELVGLIGSYLVAEDAPPQSPVSDGAAEKTLANLEAGKWDETVGAAISRIAQARHSTAEHA